MPQSGSSRPPGRCGEVKFLTYSSYRRCTGDGAAQSPPDECSWQSIAVIHELVNLRSDAHKQSAAHGTDRGAEQKLRPSRLGHVLRRFRDHRNTGVSSRGDPDRH